MKKPNRVKLKRKLDIVFSPIIRERDKGKPCIDGCGRKGEQAGHFRRRELMATRWHPQNVNGQSAYCNAWDNDGYRHAIGIDKRWGKGTAKKLEFLSRQTKQWSVEELLALIEACKLGYERYCKVYGELSPTRFDV